MSLHKQRAARTLAFIYQTVRHPRWGPRQQSAWAWRNWPRFLPLATDAIGLGAPQGRQDLQRALARMQAHIDCLKKRA